jgi:hypothetical protein
MKPHLFILFLTGLMLFVLGCQDLIDEESASTGRVIESCTFQPHPSVTSMTGAFSMKLNGRILWVFSESYNMQEGDTLFSVQPNSAAWTDVENPCHADFEFIENEDGTLKELIPLTVQEAAYNETATEGTLRIWPIGGIGLDSVAYLYYNKVFFVDYFNVYVYGTYIARVELNGNVERLDWTEHGYDDSRSWESGRDGWGVACQLSADVDDIYVYRLKLLDEGERKVQVANVPVYAIADLRGYQYLGDDNWCLLPDCAAAIVEDVQSFSVGYSAYLGRYIMIFSEPFGYSVKIRTAPQPAGYWNEAVLLYDTPDLGGFGLQNVRLHSALSDEDSPIIITSYEASGDVSHSNLHFVAVDLSAN